MDSRFGRSDDDSVRGRVEARIRNPADASIEELLELLEDGYAQALNVEGDCRTLARELAELRVDASGPEATERVRRELRAARAELRELRSALAQLRTWVEASGD